MAGRICAMYGCSNYDNSKLSGKSFFRFPRDTELCKQWVIKCKREDLDDVMKKEGSNFLNRSYRVCSDHFSDKDFRNKNLFSQGIFKGSIPSVNLPGQVRPVTPRRALKRTHTGAVVVQDTMLPSTVERDNAACIESSSGHSHDEAAQDNSGVLKHKLKNAQKTIYKYRLLVKKLNAKLKKSKTVVQSGLQRFLNDTENEHIKQFVVGQMKNYQRSSHGRRYSEDDKSLALALYYSSSKTYVMLQKLFCLPDVRSLRRWLSSVDKRPGLNENILKLLKLKSKNLDRSERVVSIVLDEISIKKHVSYHAQADGFEGYVNYGEFNDTFDHNPLEQASQAMVIMIRGLKVNFKQVLGYYLAKDALPGKYLADILKNAISKIFEAGFIPKVVVSDQGSNNIRMRSIFGITAEKPYIEVNGEVVYFLHDPPHLLKSVRNNLRKYNIEHFGAIISWSHIVEFYKKDRSMRPRLAPKLSKICIELPPFSPMRVCLAARVISHSVSRGIFTHISLNSINSTATHTAEFLEKFDNLFDIFNSSQLGSPKALRRAITPNSSHLVYLCEVEKYVKNLEVKNGRKCNPISFKGWVENIQSLKLLWADLNSNFGFSFLLTRRLTQDCIENLFSVIRGKGGNNNTPDASQLKERLKLVMTNQLLEPSKDGNCEIDMSQFIILKKELEQLDNRVTIDCSNNVSIPDKPESESEPVAENLVQQNASSYVTAWACSQLPHEDCKSVLATNQKSNNLTELYIQNKKFENANFLFPTAESDICTFAHLKHHYASKYIHDTKLFDTTTRPAALKALYDAAAKTPVHLMRQLDRWRRDGHRSSRFFLCTPVLGRRKIKTNVDIDIETRMPAAVEELRRWTSSEALGDMTVTPDCTSRIVPNNLTFADGDITDGTVVSDDEGIDHKLPSPEEQLQVVALKFPAEIVAVDISGRSFDRMSAQRRSLIHGDILGGATRTGDQDTKRRVKPRRPRSRRRNTLAGTDQKEIQDALAHGDEPSTLLQETEPSTSGAVCRSKSSDILRSTTKKESPENKKSHFNTLKQWGKSRYDKFMNKSSETKDAKSEASKKDDPDTINIYETIANKRNRNIDKTKKKTHERSSSASSSEKSNASLPVSAPMSSVMNIAVKLRDSTTQRRRRSGAKDEPHSSSGNWSASSESGRTSIASETTTNPKSTTSNATSNNSLNQQPPSSVNSRRRFNINMSASGSCTSEGTLTPDIIHDLHEDGETSSVYSCDTEGYYTSFHMDSGLKTLKEEEMPSTPLHSTSAFSNSSSNNTILNAENEYELFGKGSTSTTTSSAGTVCTTLRAGDSDRSLINGPAVPERKSSLPMTTRKEISPESSLERDQSSDKTGTVKRSPTSGAKANVVAVVHKQITGDVSPDSGHNTSSSPIESINSPNGVRSGSEFEFSESSDMEGAERIERIRVKTTINSSRIPSMCVITPPHSDDESIKSYSPQIGIDKRPEFMNQNYLGSKNSDKANMDLPIKQTTIDNLKDDHNKQNKIKLINVNPQSGYATVETIESEDCDINKNSTKLPSVIGGILKGNGDNIQSKTFRAPSPSGGTLTIKEEQSKNKSPQSQPIFKASLMPLNNMIGKLRLNIANVMHKRDSKSPSRPSEGTLEDTSGEYVTIADVRNNNEKVMPKSEEITYTNDIVTKNLRTILTGKLKETEYVSLNELPSSETSEDTGSATSDSLERKKRQGARVTLDAEGKVVYSSDSLKRRKGAHTTFEPGPFVKFDESPSPLPTHRTPKTVKPVNSNNKQDKLSVPPIDSSRPLSPQFGKIVIKAASGSSAPASEIVRMPPTTIVTPNIRSMSPKPIQTRGGAYVHMQESGRPLSPTQDKDRVPPADSPMYQSSTLGRQTSHIYSDEMLGYQNPSVDRTIDPRYYLDSQYYYQKGSPMYQTLPSKKTQYLLKDNRQERSVTPDITRGLGRQYDPNRSDIQVAYKQRVFSPTPQYAHQQYPTHDPSLLNLKLGIPVQMPQIRSPTVPSNYSRTPQRPNYSPVSNYSSPYKAYDTVDSTESLRISPIDPRNTGTFQSSTPSGKETQQLKAAANLESVLMSPKKSTMSNEELYAIIHKSKKKMNIEDARSSPSPKSFEKERDVTTCKSPEKGYVGEKGRSRLSWSPVKGKNVDLNAEVDKHFPPSESRSRQSWACNDRKAPNSQTSRLDFKKLLLQKSSTLSPTPKKISAVEQLKLSKQTQIQNPPPNQPGQSDMNILELSGSPRNFANRKFSREIPTSPKHLPDKSKPTPKLMSPRSQWRFVNPRTDVLSSTILEDCREDESPNNSIEKKKNTVTSPNKQKISNIDEREENVDAVNRAQDVRSPVSRLAQDVVNTSLNENKPSKPYMSISQRIQAQRANFFSSNGASNKNSSNYTSQYKNQTDDNKQCSKQPALETSF